jgi:predicted MFS family arabinose efflux permease
MAQGSAGGGSSGRRWSARVLLALVVIGIVVRVGNLAFPRQFDIVNPSLIATVSPLCLVAYFFVSQRTLSNENVVKLVLAWGFVGIPLGWGVVETVINAAKLFQ